MASNPENLQISDVLEEEVDGCAAPDELDYAHPDEHDYAHPAPVVEFIPQKFQTALLKNSHYDDHICPSSDKVCFSFSALT